MISERTTTAIWVLVLVAWLGASLAALTGMSYAMWWKRDRVLYAGLPVDQQRTALLKRAGLNPDKVLKAVHLAQAWPSNVHYAIKGGGNNQSYVKYLLAPSIPSGSREYLVVLGPDAVSVVPSGEKKIPVMHDGRLSATGWIVSLLLVSGLGYGFSRCLGSARISFPEQVALGALLVCLLVVVAKAVFSSASRGMGMAALLGSAGCILFVVDILRKFVSRRDPVPVNDREATRDGSFLVLPGILRASIPACTLVLAFSFVLSLVLSTIVVPDDWDAWAIWGAKAKVLAQGAGPLSDVTYFGQADYPLLWPSVWAFSGWCSGGWEEQWSRGWGSVFFLLSAWQIGAVVFRVTGRKDAGFLCAAVFASIPKVVAVSSWSYAEAPLWLMVTCSFGRLLLSVRDGGKTDLLLAGCFAFAAVMVKNDGILFAMVAFAWLLASCGWRKWKQIILFAVPLLGYLPWLWWMRVQLKLGTHAAEGISADKGTLIYGWERLKPAVFKALEIWGDLQQWSVVLCLILAGVVLLLVRGNKRIRIDLGFPVVMIGIFFALEVFHSGSLQWQMGASWDRLTIQALPLLVMVIGIWMGRLDRQGSGHAV